MDVLSDLPFHSKNYAVVSEKKCNLFRKEERQKWINIGCKLTIKNDHKGTWNWIEKTAKTGTLNAATTQAVKDADGNLVFSTDDQLKVWYEHYKNLDSDSSHYSLYKPFWYNPFWCKTIPNAISLLKICI